MTVVEKNVAVRESILINAAPDEVWRLFSRLEEWPRWNPVCTAARHLQGSPWRTGATFQVTLKPGRRTMTLQPTVVESKPPERVVWLGKKGGIYSQHTFSFEAEGEGTRATAYEVFSGPMLWMLPFVAPPDRVRAMLAQWLQALKAEAERAGGSTRRD